MTQKHYKAIAERINAHVRHWRIDSQDTVTAGGAILGLRQLVSSLCVVFKEDNERFKPEVFTKACGF